MRITVFESGLSMSDLLVSDAKSLGLITRLVAVMNTGHSFEDVFDLLYQNIQDIIPCNRIGVALLDEKAEKLTLIAHRSDGRIHLPNGFTGILKGSSLEPLIRTRQTRIINDLEEYLEKKPTSDSTRLIVKEGMKSSLTLPLLTQDKPIGVMFFSSRERDAYNKGHEDFLKLVAGHIAIILERSRLTDEIRLKQEYLENILQNSADAIVVVDRDNVIKTWNEGAREIFGYEAEEIIGENLDILIPPEQSDQGEMEHIKEQIEREGAVRNLETVRLTKDGRRITVSVTSTLLKDKRGRMIGRSSIVRDITPLKKLQEELHTQASLAALGELAATIAHEVKNPLAGMSGAIQVLADGFPENDPRRNVIREVLHQIHRLDETVRDLLLFARPWKPSPVSIELGSLVDRILVSVKTGLSANNITFLREYHEDCASLVDPQQIEHLLINLIQNAIQAMPQGGCLTIRCLCRPDAVVMEVIDTGTGIAPEHQARLFNPFFSTKARGTGLGLSICRKIVQAHRGEISVESHHGKGTTVRVILPKSFSEKKP